MVVERWYKRNSLVWQKICERSKIYILCLWGEIGVVIRLAPCINCSRSEGQPTGSCEEERPMDDLSSSFLSNVFKSPLIRYGYCGFFKIHLVGSWKRAFGGELGAY